MPALKTPLGLALQERDFAILGGLFDSRVLTLSHIAALYFEGREEAAKKRVQKLKSAGFISERPRRAYEPAILHLTKSAFRLLHSRGHMADLPHLSLTALERRARVSDLTIAHELDVQSVKCSIVSSVGATGRFRVAEFTTWPLRYQFQVATPRGEILVKPDAFVRFIERDEGGKEFERIFFLEVDRSTESQDVLGKRAACYREYYRSGRFAEWRGGRPEDFERFPFRVLWVFKSASRRDNAARTMLALNPPILTHALLITFPEALTNPLEGWKNPQDYTSAPTGLPNRALF